MYYIVEAGYHCRTIEFSDAFFIQNWIMPITGVLYHIEARCLTPMNAKPTKRIKVEPKTFFANERTFIQWMTSVTLLVTIGSTLLALSDKHPRFLHMSLVLMMFSSVLIVYAVIIFYVGSVVISFTFS